MKNEYPLFAVRSVARLSKSNISRMFHKKKRGASKSEASAPDLIPKFVHRAQKAAVHDLLSMIAHTSTLFDGDCAKRYRLIERLNSLGSVVEEVEIGIYSHGYPCNQHYEEFEELCSLENELGYFANFDLSEEGDEYKLLSSLIRFWLDEIRCRGYSLFYLLIGSLAYEEVVMTFSALDKIRYPLHDI